MPQLSAEELRAAEAEASYTVQQVVATAVALYLCTFLVSPTIVALRSTHIRRRPSPVVIGQSLTSRPPSPVRRRRHLEDLLSIGDRDNSSYDSLLHQLEHTCTILDWRYYGSSAAWRRTLLIGMHSVSACGRWPKTFGLGNAWHQMYHTDKLLTRNERIRTPALAFCPLMTDPDRVGVGCTLASAMSATQLRALPEAMVSEAEGTQVSRICPQ